MKLVFIHGAGNNASVWEKVISRLKDFECVAFDLPGHGEKRDEAGKNSISDYADWVCENIKHLGDIIVVGHSMGGAIVLDVISRGLENVKGGVLISTGLKLRVNPKILDGLKEDFRKTAEKIAQWAVAQGNKDVLEEAKKIFTSCAPEVVYGDFVACDKFDGKALVSNIKVPVLVLVGSEDIMTPIKLSQEIESTITGSKLVIIEGAGHMLSLEKPDEVSHYIASFVEEIEK